MIGSARISRTLSRGLSDENGSWNTTCMRRLSGRKKSGESVDMWFRATATMAKENGDWKITHVHNSVPFAMDGSDKAELGLKP